MERVTGVPELLDAYTHDTLPPLTRVRETLHDYRSALSAFTAAEPNDLRTAITDRSPDLLAALDALQILDRIPAAFAAALRDLDTSYDPAAFAPGAMLHADADNRLRQLILDGVAGPWASGAQRARVAQTLRRWDDLIDAPAPLAFTVRHEDWRSTINQFGRHAGNAVSVAHGSQRLASIRARYPVSRNWLDVSAWTADELARAGGTHNRSVLHAARRAENASLALRGNAPLLPTLGVHLPPGLLTAGRVATRAVGAAGVAITVADGYSDLQDRDWGGVASNAVSLTGGALLLMGGPVTMTAGAVLVVGSLIYEANREEIDAMGSRVAQSLSGAAGSISDVLDF